MAIGERIRFLRNRCRMTQKMLGASVGFDEKSADIRMAQYESGKRTPKADLTEKLAQSLDVSPMALDIPNIESYDNLMHTLFALEDIYGIKIGEINGEVCLRLDSEKGTSYIELFERFNEWNKKTQQLKNEKIDKEQYDDWRYKYHT
ncbi:MAG: helix-turn-helix domain-containing protein [Ruminococcus sp.]|nr:helix-turn-helix domain-containing protein [Ruminococcus sp.]